MFLLIAFLSTIAMRFDSLIYYSTCFQSGSIISLIVLYLKLPCLKDTIVQLLSHFSCLCVQSIKINKSLTIA